MSSSGPSDDPRENTQSLSQAVQSADFFRSLVENGSDAIVSIDEDSRIIYANQSVERIFGYTPNEMVGEKLTIIMPDRFHEAHFGAFATYLETNERTIDWNDIELPAQHKDGREITLSITFEQHEYDGERIFSGIMRDVSDRISHEENLVTLQETARDLMQTQDKQKIAEEVVSAAEETLEFPVVSVFFNDGRRGQLKPVAHSEAVQDVLGEAPNLGQDSLAWKAVRDGEIQQYKPETTSEAAVFRPDGPISSEYIFPLGNFGCLLVSTTDDQDLDDRTYALAQILAATAESALERAEREIQNKQQRERLERFANIVSHDLRDPINTARATLAVARAGDEEAFDELDGLFDRMDELISDVLTLAKQGRAVGAVEPVAVEQSVTAAWETIQPEAATLQTGTLPSVSADPERLQALFENLFRNAIEHAGPTVTVSVGGLEDKPGFYVADDGPGLGDVDPERLFEYGYTTQEDNTGFGLNIVSEIVDAHGWAINAAAGDQSGARFEVVTR